jgi:predicted metal-binding membrane protein
MAPAAAPWKAIEFAFVFAMWAVMMIGMMTPSAAPMIMNYARVGRQAAQQGKPLAASAYFAGGYLIAWIGFAVLATWAQWALDRSGLLTPTMAGANDVFGGAVLIAAGLYQWMPLKDACLRHCQAPLWFIQRYGGFRADARGALALGLRHGGYCIGCCWALMALLFVGGVMNVVWIAALAILVLAEKVVPAGRAVSRVAGLGLVAAGIWFIVHAT